MANSKRGYAEIRLDKARNLRYSWNALAMLEEGLGRPTSSVVEELNNRTLAFKTLRYVLYCGLKHEDESLTLEQVGDMVDASNVADVMAAVVKALMAALVGEKAAAEADKAAKEAADKAVNEAGPNPTTGKESSAPPTPTA